MQNPVLPIYKGVNAQTENIDGYDIITSTSGEEQEYSAIRNHIGITDRSDEAKFKLVGDGAADMLGEVLTGNIINLPENALRHTLLLDDAGAIIADVYVYNNFDYFLVRCSGHCRSLVRQQLQQHIGSGVEMEDITDQLAVLCLDGPYAWQIPVTLTGAAAAGLPVMHFMEARIADIDTTLVRAGRAGEYGYECVVPAETAEDALKHILGADPDALLCGRSVFDLLQRETRAFNLQCDIPNGESPLQAGLHWAIDFRKDSFIGKNAVMREIESGLSQKMVGLKMTSDGIPATAGKVYADSDEVGYIAAAGYSPTLQTGIALAYLKKEYAWAGIDFEADTDRGIGKAATVSTPFFVMKSMTIPIT